jgi:hypothetical protein
MNQAPPIAPDPQHSSSRALHLILRTPERAVVAFRKSISIVDEHNKLWTANGEVLLGKFGMPLASRVTMLLRSRLTLVHPPKLFLVMKSKGNFFGYEAEMSRLVDGCPPDSVQHLIPSYYTLLSDTPQSWIGLRTPLKKGDLSQLSLLSSGRNLLNVLSECRTAAMLVI